MCVGLAMASQAHSVGKPRISSPDRMRRLSKSDSKLDCLALRDAASPQHVRPASRSSTSRPVARLLEVLRVDNVLTSEQAQAATSHFELMPVSVAMRTHVHVP